MPRLHVVRIGSPAALIVGSLCSVTAGDILDVPGDHPTIQSAIDHASDGDEVVVAPGTYPESIDFLGKSIVVHSTGGAEVTTIDATGLGASAVTCVLSENPDTLLGGFTITGGTADAGGGMWMAASSATIIDCVFQGNVALIGGGLALVIGSTATVVNCRISQNGSGGIAIGRFCNVTLVNCVIDGNGGQGVYSEGDEVDVVNCTVVDNGGGLFNVGNAATVSNSVFRGEGDQFFDGASSLTVNYCNVEGGYPGDGNIDDDPLFADAASGDFRLLAGSPCIDAGNTTIFPAGITTDFDGNPRFVDDPATANTGLGDPPIDMGAFERQIDGECPADIDGDGDVGFSDLLLVLSAWGNCPPPCPEDVDGDGSVGFSDLLIVLGAWGPCV